MTKGIEEVLYATHHTDSDFYYFLEASKLQLVASEELSFQTNGNGWLLFED